MSKKVAKPQLVGSVQGHERRFCSVGVWSDHPSTADLDLRSTVGRDGPKAEVLSDGLHQQQSVNRNYSFCEYFARTAPSL